MSKLWPFEAKLAVQSNLGFCKPVFGTMHAHPRPCAHIMRCGHIFIFKDPKLQGLGWATPKPLRMSKSL